MRRHKWYWCFPLGPANGGCFLRIWDSPNVEEDSFELNLKSGWMQKYLNYVKIIQNPLPELNPLMITYGILAYLGDISNASWFYRSSLAICWTPHGDSKAIHRCSWTLHWTRASPMLEAHLPSITLKVAWYQVCLVNPHLPVKDVHPQDVAFQSMIITILYTWLYIYIYDIHIIHFLLIIMHPSSSPSRTFRTGPQPPRSRSTTTSRWMSCERWRAAQGDGRGVLCGVSLTVPGRSRCAMGKCCETHVKYETSWYIMIHWENLINR